MADKILNKTSNKIELHNKTGFYEKKGAIFANESTVLLVLVIALIFIGYVVYIYFYSSTDNIIKQNSSYYGQNILLYEPLFQETTNTINDCIDLCKNDVTCDGITYNKDTQVCMGTKNGQIRNETAAYSAWVKPQDTNTTISTDFKKAILVGYTKSSRAISGIKIANPYMLGNYCYAFNLTIYDFYKNYGSWRHIFHKGTDIKTGSVLDYQSWENLVKDIPNQVIGVWLAPFTNNLRIAVKTTTLSNRTYGSYSDAFVEKCDDNGHCFITDMPSGKWVDTSKASDGSNPNTKVDSYLEYFDQDLQNIPINSQVNIIINFRNNNVEVYFNGKIVKITQLDGTPNSDKSNLYVLNDKTVNCDISNLIYYPSALKITDIQQIVSITPQTE
jgi:hypothetical protein